MSAPGRDAQPVTEAERYVALDALRGLALLGVLLVNLHSSFRVPLTEHLLHPHTDLAPVDRAADVVITAVLEFKAFAVFSMLFGVGMAVFADWSDARGADVGYLLARRLTSLLVLGLAHMLLVWNGDILTLYAVCGFLFLPLVQLPAAGLAASGAAAVVLSFYLPWDLVWPTDGTLRRLAADAARAYSGGSYAEVMAFHWRESRELVLVLLAMSIPWTWGLMALGAAAWKSGVLREPGRHRGALRAVTLGGGLVGGGTTALSVAGAVTDQPTGVPALLNAAAPVLLALAYTAGLLLVLRSPAARSLAAPFAAAGRMALTNYLTQSVVLGLLFYGYGLGLFGRLGSAGAAGVGLAVYASQLALSRAWLQRYQFGPVEWLWRSFTYGHRQPFRRTDGAGVSGIPGG